MAPTRCSLVIIAATHHSKLDTNVYEGWEVTGQARTAWLYQSFVERGERSELPTLLFFGTTSRHVLPSPTRRSSPPFRGGGWYGIRGRSRCAAPELLIPCLTGLGGALPSLIDCAFKCVRTCVSNASMPVRNFCIPAGDPWHRPLYPSQDFWPHVRELRAARCDAGWPNIRPWLPCPHFL